MATQPITLGPGEQGTLVFEFTPTEAGTHVVRGDGIEVSFNVTEYPEKREAPADGRGDVNMDGWVDEEDAKLIRWIVLGLYPATEEQLRRADVNCDGVVTRDDESAVYTYIYFGELPVCEAETGVNLVAGWNNDIPYLGEYADTADAVASIIDKVIVVWVERDDEWLLWTLGVPEHINSLHEIYHGELVRIQVNEDCFWEW